MDNGNIPLFPLSIVVFPGDLFTLHIFEDKYKQLLKDINTKDGRRPFGIACLFDVMLAQVGCCCVVERVLTIHSDGSLEILVRGTLRFRSIEERQTGTPYTTVNAEFFDDDDKREIDATLRARVLTLFTKYTELESGEPLMRDFASEEFLSFKLASYIKLTNSQRQMLVEITSEHERLQSLDSILTEQVSKMSQEQSIEEKVKSNGHLIH